MELHSEKLQTKTPFLDLTRDYGFKIVFADPDRKELMTGFLNKIITERNIIDIRFLNTDILAPRGRRQEPQLRHQLPGRRRQQIPCRDSEGDVRRVP